MKTKPNIPYYKKRFKALTNDEKGVSILKETMFKLSFQ